ncbi:glycosyltransferase family 4 protein [Geomonas sp. RF6]|uniref:glycosyltransferase family 4 protein n=1 Tax=Geomonas sp. RF6 TaxID=2897342 RepID=UPI001E617922|nr:glycosyltransferase family 4 protein [Geomonas sp. RF6]UFS69931.1 glycosyltransferase family 4 protein [Geomonas sp. RF6]
MRILRLYPFLPPLPGGMERHIQRLSEEQRRLGCQVTILFNRGEGTAPCDLRVLSWLNLRKVRPQALRDLLYYLAVALKAAATGIRADVVHVHGDWSAFFLGRLVRAITGASRSVASLHCAPPRKGWHLVYRAALKGYSVVYTTGAGDAAYLRERCKVPACWQNSGVDEHFFEGVTAPAETLADVVCVANFLPVKNHALVLEIARALPERRFLLIGDGPLRAPLEEHCLTSGLANVFFAGRLSGPEVRRALAGSRVFLSTALREGTPTALLEAMGCGLPVVISASNDYGTLVREGENGYVVEGFAPERYVALLRGLLAEGERLKEMGERNRQESRRHVWPEVARRITGWMEAV